MRNFRALAKTLAVVGFWAQDLRADVAEQAARLHRRLTAIEASPNTLEQMTALGAQGKWIEAGALAINRSSNPLGARGFYGVTVKQFGNMASNKQNNPNVPFNDLSALVVGLTRDEIPFDRILYGDEYYVANPAIAGLTGTFVTVGGTARTAEWRLELEETPDLNDYHYEYIENRGLDLSDPNVLMRIKQGGGASGDCGPNANASCAANAANPLALGLPAQGQAGVITTKAFAKAFMNAGTNRGAWRYTIMNWIGKDMEQLFDNTVPDYRVRRDVDRHPGGSAITYQHSCKGCHAIQDPLASAFAYHNFDNETRRLVYSASTDGTAAGAVRDPAGQVVPCGPVVGTRCGMVRDDNANGPTTISRRATQFGVAWKINGSGIGRQFETANPPRIPWVDAFLVTNDEWVNLITVGQNAYLGWPTAGADGQSVLTGRGVKALGKVLARTDAFALHMANKSFRLLCGRDTKDDQEKRLVTEKAMAFKQDYLLKKLFLAVAPICLGE